MNRLLAVALSLALALPMNAVAETEGEVPVSRVVLTDGQQLTGKVVEQDDETLVLELATGARMELPMSSVRSVSAVEARVTASGELRFADPNRTRYFYTPSGMMLKQGEGYFSQKELIFSSVAYGLTDNITLLAGAVVPAWFAGVSGLNVIAGVKVGATVVPDVLHVAAGAETLMIPSIIGSGVGGGAGFLFGTVTVGSRDAHFSVAAGRPFFFGGNAIGGVGDFLFTLSGNYRISKSVALVTENWVMPSFTNGSTTMLVAPGIRIMGERIAVDIGGIWPVYNGASVTAGIPIPWLDFTWNFGG